MKDRSLQWLLGAWLLGHALAVAGPAPEAPPHWAFQPIQDPAIPDVIDDAWCRTSIDRFILARLEKAGLAPAPEADPRTLLRRVAFGLTGLPPSAIGSDALAADPSPGAFAQAVEQLLASPGYGERWGRHWLDVVRYADTAGETADYPVPVAWRYRNYVIDAFNADKPYDVFLREQIAGDILAQDGPRERYAEQVAATGFLALSRRFGFDSENYHHLTLQDTIDTLGQGVLGLTLGCARCHTHKYDPVPIADYYALYGIFESTRYAFPGSEQKQRHRALVPLVPPGESQLRWREFENRVAALSRKAQGRGKPVPTAVLRSLDDLDGDFEMQAPAAGGSKGVLVPPWVHEGSIAITTDAQSPFKNLHPMGRVGADIPAGAAAYHIRQALPSHRSRAVSGQVHVNLDFRVTTDGSPAPGRHRFWLGNRTDPAAVEVFLSDQSLTIRTGDSTVTLRPLESGEWVNLQLTLDLSARTVSGRAGVPGDLTDLPARQMASDWNGALEAVGFDAPEGGDARPALALDNLGIETGPIPPASTQPTRPASDPADPDPVAIEADLAAEADAAAQELERLLAEGPMELAYAVSEGTPRNARIQLRGEPDRAGDEVPRGFLTALGGESLPPGVTGSGRLELAHWLTSPSNPLTARVMVNRIWQHHFGQGLVKTPNDFGLRGQPPTHPELLDHLATLFIRSGWSVKAMHRLILDSAVYRQRSRTSTEPTDLRPAPATADCPVLPSTPGLPRESVATASDDLFSPFTRRRLCAEETRDAILLASGALELSRGEGHPFPSPTGWSYTQHGPYSAVYEHRRRSVYLMAQRLKRHPFLALFDGADPNASTPQRHTTTVPTQALFFLNDPLVHEQAALFTSRVLGSAPDEPGRIRTAYRLALGRSPTPIESTEAANFLAAYRSGLATASHPDPIGGAWAALARVLFGSNEFLTVD